MASIVSSPSDGSAARPARDLSPFALAWRELEPLPDPVGLKGMYAGVSGEHVLLAGGSNFPLPASAGGRKTFHAAIVGRALPLSASTSWHRVGELSGPLAEGAAVTLPEGVLCLGGHDGQGPVAAVFLLQWHAAEARIERVPWPDLPLGVASSAAAVFDGAVYIAGGETPAGTAEVFWRLDLEEARSRPHSARWEALPTWPGRARLGCILMPVTTPAGSRLLLAGGVHAPAKSQDDYHRNAFLFDRARRQWTPAAAMPRGAVLAGAIQASPTEVLVLGGSDGHDFARMRELGERYRIPDDAFMYDGSSDRWLPAGRMPVGVVAPAITELREGWLVAGGEYSPGLRTARAFLLTLVPRARE